MLQMRPTLVESIANGCKGGSLTTRSLSATYKASKHYKRSLRKSGRAYLFATNGIA
jgi:hypothetical protein